MYIDSLVLKVSASRNSFHAARKEKRAVTATAGRDSGRTIFQNTCVCEHPSISAASSSSRGTVSKKPLSIHTHSGRAVTE